ncbi:MAG: hypothetical protein HKN33_17435 [Pyrinomonadaceae bacterium]|nr:hypothetical protein [Pyrinomonadaceae bacterium]
MEQIKEEIDLWQRARVFAWVFGLFALCLPLVAMQFTEEVNWSLGDFIVFGGMLAGVGILFELAARSTKNTGYRIGVGLALLGAFLLTWANLAVGIIGNENNEANVLYFGLLLLGFIGALVVRFKPSGMAFVMAAVTVLLIMIAAFALFLGLGSSSPTWPRGIVVATVLLGALWIGSALCFRKAGRES